MKQFKYDFEDEREKIEKNVDEIQEICYIRSSEFEDLKQEVIDLSDRILVNLDNLDWAFSEITDDYEDRIDELEKDADDYIQQIEELKAEIKELKGGK